MAIVWRLRGNIIRTAPCWVVWRNVHSQQHTHVSSSYRSSRLGLSHWDPYAMHRGGCLELYYCNMVEWSWSDSSLIWKTNWFPSVLCHCWFGHMTCKNRPRYDIMCLVHGTLTLLNQSINQPILFWPKAVTIDLFRGVSLPSPLFLSFLYFPLLPSVLPSVTVTVTGALVLRPLLKDRGCITESICILVPVDRMKQKCFQITTKRIGRSQQFQLRR